MGRKTPLLGGHCVVPSATGLQVLQAHPVGEPCYPEEGA